MTTTTSAKEPSSDSMATAEAPTLGTTRRNYPMSMGRGGAATETGRGAGVGQTAGRLFTTATRGAVETTELCADSPTMHVMQLARQALPMGLNVAKKLGTIEDAPSIPSLMIRNVPTLYTPEELHSDMKMLGLHGGVDFDFLYLPLNAKKRRRNRGYAFLNLRTTRATTLILQLHNTYLPKHGPPVRPLGICASDVQGFEANWCHFAHVYLDSSFNNPRSRQCEGPMFWKDGKEMEARRDGEAMRLKREATNYGYACTSAASACASLHFCVMCGKPRCSYGRFCAECGWDLLAYCSNGAIQPAMPHDVADEFEEIVAV
eukprot:GEMP01067283.1.p1 GENE.GEMP01067283.1~~GEMP01067283.1.p1  ORF type:complete len:318 (+),score=83.06 GEMP01067283.1:156-1109(+)